MSTGHLTEEEIQDFAIGGSSATDEVQQHVATCPACAASVAAYQSLFAAVVSQPGPAFDFNVVDVVAVAIDNAGNRRRAPFLYVFAAIIMLAVSAAGLMLQANLTDLFTGISRFFVYASVGGALLIVIFQVIAIAKRYRQRFEYLSKWPELQPYSGTGVS